MNGKRAKELRRLSKETGTPVGVLKKAFKAFARINTVNNNQADAEIHRVQRGLLPRVTDKG